jgi:hypothetical protein
MNEFAGKWAFLHRWRRTFVLLLIAYVPAIALFDHFFQPHFHSVAPTVVLALAWLFLVHLASVRLGTFRCPRCNKPFASPEDSVTNTWTLARKCKHCGLPKYSGAI